MNMVITCLLMIGQVADASDREKGKYTLIRDADDFQPSIYDKPLPCFGCGVGWFSYVSDPYLHFSRCLSLLLGVVLFPCASLSDHHFISSDFY